MQARHVSDLAEFANVERPPAVLDHQQRHIVMLQTAYANVLQVLPLVLEVSSAVIVFANVVLPLLVLVQQLHLTVMLQITYVNVQQVYLLVLEQTHVLEVLVPPAVLVS